MGTLSCIRCKATAEGNTFEEADEKIDHAIGTSKGWPCSGNPDFLVWSGGKSVKSEPSPEPIKEPPKPSKSKK